MNWANDERRRMITALQAQHTLPGGSPCTSSAGVSGNTGSVVASTLLAQGHAVRVIVRDEKKGERRGSSKGAEVAVASLDDAAALTAALRGADGVYALVPPNFADDDSLAAAGARRPTAGRRRWPRPGRSTWCCCRRSAPSSTAAPDHRLRASRRGEAARDRRQADRAALRLLHGELGPPRAAGEVGRRPAVDGHARPRGADGGHRRHRPRRRRGARRRRARAGADRAGRPARLHARGGRGRAWRRRSAAA